MSIHVIASPTLALLATNTVLAGHLFLTSMLSFDDQRIAVGQDPASS